MDTEKLLELLRGKARANLQGCCFTMSAEDLDAVTLGQLAEAERILWESWSAAHERGAPVAAMVDGRARDLLCQFIEARLPPRLVARLRAPSMRVTGGESVPGHEENCTGGIARITGGNPDDDPPVRRCGGTT